MWSCVACVINNTFSIRVVKQKILPPPRVAKILSHRTRVPSLCFHTKLHLLYVWFLFLMNCSETVSASTKIETEIKMKIRKQKKKASQQHSEQGIVELLLVSALVRFFLELSLHQKRMHICNQPYPSPIWVYLHSSCQQLRMQPFNVCFYLDTKKVRKKTSNSSETPQ